MSIFLFLEVYYILMDINSIYLFFIGLLLFQEREDQNHKHLLVRILLIVLMYVFFVLLSCSELSE